MSLPYSQKTQDLIDRQCRNVEREDFNLDKNTAEECLLKTYDLFNLPRELLMQAKEAGMGYRVEVEWEDVLYCVSTPIVLIDDRNRFHSTKKPAIRWKGGEELYYLHGVNFDKKWWKKIVNDEMSPATIFAIDNLEHRRIAYEFMDKTKMKQLKNYKILDEQVDDQGNQMKIISFTVKGIDEPLKYYNCFCPSTKREYFLGTDKDKCWEAKLSSYGLTDKFDKEF